MNNDDFFEAANLLYYILIVLAGLVAATTHDPLKYLAAWASIIALVICKIIAASALDTKR